jgi:predicted transcriptional regulator
MNLPSKKIYGAMRKLVTDGYVEKFGQNPVIYSLTEQGKNFDITSYKETLNNEEDIH